MCENDVERVERILKPDVVAGAEADVVAGVEV